MSGFSRSALVDVVRSRFKTESPAGHRWMSGFSRSALVDVVKSRLKAELQQATVGVPALAGPLWLMS